MSLTQQLRQQNILEHKAELRMLQREEQRVARRIAELQRILTEIYGQ